MNKYQKTIGIAALLVSILLATAPFALAADAEVGPSQGVEANPRTRRRDHC